MSSGECRRSARISELDARRAQQLKRQNEGNGTSKLGMAQDSGTKKDSYQKLGRKRKTRPVHDLVDSKVHCEAQKTGTLTDEDHHKNPADMSSRIAIPERKKLELLLNKLKRRDFYRIFAEPVDPMKVEGYYDVIKEPMDFSTITEKLNRGSYRLLEEFEHDISLVYNNAMHFNASDTIYYKQGHAIKELANKLFRTLKTNPKNFETECTMRSVGPGRRTKAVSGSLNSNSHKTTGHRAEKKSQNFELQPRWTYTPHTFFLNKNELSVAEVYNNSKNLEPVNENKIGYAQSLMRFANNLGPTAQMVAERKLERDKAETSRPQIATSSCHLQASNNQIPAIASAHKDISTAPFFKFLGNSVCCHQRFSGRDADIQSNTLDGGKASAVDTLDIYDVLRGGIMQASSTMKTLGEIREKMLHAQKNQIISAASGRNSITVAPSVRVLGHSAGCHNLSGEELDIQSGTLCRQKTSAIDTVNVSDALGSRITHTSSTNGNLGDFQQKMIQATNGCFDMATAFKEHISTAGDGKLEVPAEWKTNSTPNKFSFVKLMLDAIMDSTDQTAEVVSSGSKLPEFLPTGFSCPSSSWQLPLQSMLEGSSRNQATDFRHEVDFHNLGVVPQIQAMADREGPSFGGNIEQGGKVSNWFNLMEGGPSSNRALDSMQGLDSHYLGVDIVPQIQASFVEADPSHEDKVLQESQVSNWFKSTGSGAAGAGPSHGDNINGGQLSNWFKPTQLGPEPVPDDWFQQQCRSLAEVELLYQAEPPQHQGWAITPGDGKTMKASDMCDYSKCGTSGQEGLRIGAPAGNRQKQPLQDFGVPQWVFQP